KPTPIPTPTSTPAPAPTPTPTVADMVEKIRPSVVRINTSLGDGSGFIFEIPQTGGVALVLTNAHVVEGAEWINVTLNDSTTFSNEILGIDPAQDLAVLKICCGHYQALEFGDASRLRARTRVVAIGYPSGISGKASVTGGIVLAVRLNRGRWVIQTDAAIDPGISGGPLLSLSGEVLGINTSKYATTESGVPVEGIGFAVSEVSVLQDLLALKSGDLLPTPTPRIIPTPTPTPRPPPTPTPTPNPVSYFNEGNRLMNLRMYREAILQFTIAIRGDFNYALAYSRRGGSYTALGEHVRAIADYDKAIRLQPTATFYNERGVSFAALRKYEEAILDYDQAIRLAPTALYYTNRGNANSRLARTEQANSDWAKATACRLEPRYC
ncbi:MAG: trypsin-like peptidase domain-containing protein, partial [Chloroflexi bacterium]|nr:trypsin-like peptidase domain-containing protein [Chloroflexota bacterium]